MADSCAKRCAIAQARRTVVLHRRRQKFCFDEAGWHASAPLGVCCCSPSFALAGPGEHSIQPTLWDASPDVVRSLRASFLVFLMHTLTYVILLLPFPGVYRCEAAARRSCKWARASAPTSTTIASTIRRTLEVSEAHKARRPMRPSHTPCESPPSVHSLEARSAVQ